MLKGALEVGYIAAATATFFLAMGGADAATGSTPQSEGISHTFLEFSGVSFTAAVVLLGGAALSNFDQTKGFIKERLTPKRYD